MFLIEKTFFTLVVKSSFLDFVDFASFVMSLLFSFASAYSVPLR
jgi:hypothetical protein